jgi:leucyl-tRNA synthetase
VEETSPDVFIEKETGEKLERVIAKMSKSLKNVINPDDVIRDYGADSVRMYEMFMGPLEVSKPWNTNGLIGVHRFLEKIWAVSEKPMTDEDMEGKLEGKLAELRKLYHKTIKKVSQDTDTLNFNTAISQMMIFINDASKMESIPKALWSGFVKLLSPYAPHLGEELWEKLGNTNTIAYESWPTYKEELCQDDSCTIVVQINGKKRADFQAAINTDKAELEKQALSCEAVIRFMEGKSPVKVIVVPNKLVNIVIK